MASKSESTAIELKVFGKLSNEKINLFSPPYNVRNNCQVGQWARSESDFIAPALNIAIIKMAEFYGKLGKSEGKWLQIWFIGAPGETRIPKNTVCVTYIKTRSISAFGQKVIEAMQEDDPAVGIFETEFEKHSNDYGNYYSVKFKWRRRSEEEKAQLVLIANFLNNAPILEDLGLPKTMVKVINGNYDQAEIAYTEIMQEELNKKTK